MKHYIGIDLGTTNSAISVYDGEILRLLKSPDQNDVTPSAIFIDKRGNQYIGKRAYDQAARSPGGAAILFKRLIGTNTPIKMTTVNRSMSPEECSAEILRALFGYLPEEIRNNSETGTVITVPAAFNQMQKDATMAAAEMAALGKVAIMQEPVAAVMSVMRHRKADGVFLVYDIGGGTLDIAIAQSINGRVSLLAHGGIAMCGGRDFDRLLFDNVVSPWLMNKFNLPEDFSSNKRYATLRSQANWALEKAKIELSSSEEASIALDDSELRIKDESDEDIYLDITITRSVLNDLISFKIEDSIASARESMEKAGLSPHDIGRIVFVGGPAQYKPLRDKVAFELGIAASTDVNPMTAVAEGAALFAESIDWSTQNRGRKCGRGTLSAGGDLDITFNYQARTPDSKAKVVVILGGKATGGTSFQVDSLDTGWSSGKVELKDGAVIEVPLAKPGENVFKVFVFDIAGGSINLTQDKFTISRTAAQIDAIPASHSIGVEALDKIGGGTILEYLVREGDQLPQKGKKTFKALESLRAGAAGSIKFKIWEGNIQDPITDNRFVGVFEIKGSDLSDGVIGKGADLLCDYEILDSGNIVLEVTVPSIGSSFNSARNFYSRQEGQIDYTKATRRLQEEAERIDSRLKEIASKIDDPKLEQAREQLERADLANNSEDDPEVAKQAMDNIQEAKKLLAQARKEHLKVIRQLEFDKFIQFFDTHVRQHSRPTELNSFDSLVKTAQRSIDSNSNDFESYLDGLRNRAFLILWRQDWFIIDRFKWLSEDSFLFSDQSEHTKLSELGRHALQTGDIEKLREVVHHLDSTRVVTAVADDMFTSANILVG